MSRAQRRSPSRTGQGALGEGLAEADVAQGGDGEADEVLDEGGLLGHHAGQGEGALVGVDELGIIARKMCQVHAAAVHAGELAGLSQVGEEDVDEVALGGGADGAAQARELLQGLEDAGVAHGVEALPGAGGDLVHGEVVVVAFLELGAEDGEIERGHGGVAALRLGPELVLDGGFAGDDVAEDGPGIRGIARDPGRLVRFDHISHLRGVVDGLAGGGVEGEVDLASGEGDDQGDEEEGDVAGAVPGFLWALGHRRVSTRAGVRDAISGGR
jgi:hypothetical protein